MIISANTMAFENGFSDWSFDFSVAGTWKLKSGGTEEFVVSTTSIQLKENTTVTGYVDASAGFKDNGVAGIDKSRTIAAGDQIVISGGIVTSYTEV